MMSKFDKNGLRGNKLYLINKIHKLIHYLSFFLFLIFLILAGLYEELDVLIPFLNQIVIRFAGLF
jgi:hypothetical protein